MLHTQQLLLFTLSAVTYSKQATKESLTFENPPKYANLEDIPLQLQAHRSQVSGFVLPCFNPQKVASVLNYTHKEINRYK